MDIWTSIHSIILLLEPDLPPEDWWSFTWTLFLFLKSWGENGAIHVVSRGSQHHTLKWKPRASEPVCCQCCHIAEDLLREWSQHPKHCGHCRQPNVDQRIGFPETSDADSDTPPHTPTYMIFLPSSLIPAWACGLFLRRRPHTNPPSQFSAPYTTHCSKQCQHAMSQGVWRKEEKRSLVSQAIKTERTEFRSWISFQFSHSWFFGFLVAYH